MVDDSAPDDDGGLSMTTLKIGAIGCGYWGPNLIRNFIEIPESDLIAIAEVVRDLHRTDDQREQSYSERQLYEAALERLTREVAAVADGDEVAAAGQIDEVLMSRAPAAA